MGNHEVVEALRNAVLDLASNNPDSELTVAAVAGAAGISRDEFYRNASSPIQLLADALSDELLSQYEELEDQYPDELIRAMRARISLIHLAKWAKVYGGPVRKQLMQALRQTLEPSLRIINEKDIRKHPELLPEGISLDDDLAIKFVSAYNSGGGMAGIEVWVDQPEPDVERGLQLLSAVSSLPHHLKVDPPPQTSPDD
ncbi:hypothetical protein [Streptosporangium sp. NPDC002607]